MIHIHTLGQEVELGGHSVSVTSERVKQILQQLNKFLHSKIVSNEIKEELFSKEVITFKVKEKMANQKSTEESNEVVKCVSHDLVHFFNFESTHLSILKVSLL